jgi:hypothetical protein
VAICAATIDSPKTDFLSCYFLQSNDAHEALALMATDPQIQNELGRIEQEFSYAEADGWRQPDAHSAW